MSRSVLGKAESFGDTRPLTVEEAAVLLEMRLTTATGSSATASWKLVHERLLTAISAPERRRQAPRQLPGGGEVGGRLIGRYRALSGILATIRQPWSAFARHV
jgi:hypothetical protein